jgi:hypothetical protein
VRPEQPDTPANETAPPVVDPVVAPAVTGEGLPLAEPVRPRRPRRDPAEAAREARRIRRGVRVMLLAIAAILTAVFVIAFRIHPYDAEGNPRTMATHTQIGMPPCNFVVLTGKPCPSCGMTTSFALLVRGDVVNSLKANWVGSTICVLWALTLVWAVASAAWGKMLFVPPGRGELVFTIIVGAVVFLMLARWGVLLLAG